MFCFRSGLARCAGVLPLFLLTPALATEMAAEATELNGASVPDDFPPATHKPAPGEIHYSPLLGGTVGGTGRRFSVEIAPEGGRLLSIEVCTASERPELLRGLRFRSRDRDGTARERVVGRLDGRCSRPFLVPRGVRLVGASGSVGWFVDGLRFHLSNGRASPRYGGAGGDTDFQLFLKRRASRYLGELRGLWGTVDRDYIEALGLVFMPDPN
jgi:hypothetical protein